MIRLRWLRPPSVMQGVWRGWSVISGNRLPYALTLVWLLHIQLLLGADTLAAAIDPAVQTLPARYYLIHSLPPLLLLGLGLLRPVTSRLEPHLLPIVLVSMTILSLVLTPLAIDEPRSGPLIGSTNVMAFRMLPLHLLVFIIVAVRYRWPHLVGLCLGIGVLLLTVNWLAWSQMPPGVIVLYLIGFLINGRCITLLVERLRDRTEALSQANQQLRHYASTLEQLTVSRERNRMARELHDTLAHTLADLTVQMETAKAYVTVNPSVTREILDTALAAARIGLHDTRRSLKSLRASPLVELGLAAALDGLAHATADVAGVELDLAIDPALPALPPDTEQAIYRIAQEALANVKYHAGASRLSVSLSASADVVRLAIRDDGRGFAQAAPVTAGHFGLIGMQEWAQITGGALHIASAPGEGTLIEIEIGV